MWSANDNKLFGQKKLPLRGTRVCSRHISQVRFVYPTHSVVFFFFGDGGVSLFFFFFFFLGVANHLINLRQDKDLYMLVLYGQINLLQDKDLDMLVLYGHLSCVMFNWSPSDLLWSQPGYGPDVLQAPHTYVHMVRTITLITQRW